MSACPSPAQVFPGSLPLTHFSAPAAWAPFSLLTRFPCARWPSTYVRRHEAGTHFLYYLAHVQAVRAEAWKMREGLDVNSKQLASPFRESRVQSLHIFYNLRKTTTDNKAFHVSVKTEVPIRTTHRENMEAPHA